MDDPNGDGDNSDSIAPDFSAGILKGADLGLVKIGAGDQILSFQTSTAGTVTVKEGQLILANTATGAGNFGTLFVEENGNTRSATSFVDVLDGATLRIESTKTTDEYEWMRYLTSSDSGTTAKLAFGGDDFQVELGLDSTDGPQTFTGVVSTPATADKTGTIKVTELTGWQKVGKLEGAGDFQKEGGGVLEITGDSTGYTGGVKLNGGTLVLGHAEAIGGQGIDAGNFVAGKVSVGTGVTIDDTFTTDAASTGKTMIGGIGTYANTIVLDDAVGAHTFRELDPGLAASVSLSSVTSPYQSVQNEGNTIGSFTAAGLTWNDGGIYNWEIKDFGGSEGTDWDLFSFTSGSVDFVKGQTYTIRPLAVDNSTGASGAPDAFIYSMGTSSSPFKFLAGPSFTLNTGSGSVAIADGYVFDSDFFNIDDSEFAWATQDFRGYWQVKHQSNALYLVYSAVPEPSTYVMVVGAMFLPVWSFFRRRRSRRKEEE